MPRFILDVANTKYEGNLDNKAFMEELCDKFGNPDIVIDQVLIALGQSEYLLLEQHLYWEGDALLIPLIFEASRQTPDPMLTLFDATQDD